MKILIFSWRGFGHPYSGGAEIVTHQHAKAWVKAGHQVALFTSAYPSCKPVQIIDGVEIIRRGNQILGVQLQAFLWYFFEGRKFDLVIDQFHGLPFFTPLFVGAKKLAFIHEVAKEIWDYNPWPKPFNLLPKYFGKMVEPLMFKLLYGSTQFLTVSNSTREDLMEWGIGKQMIKVIHNGVIVKLPAQIKKTAAPTLIYLGALAKDKGIEDAIGVFGRLYSLNESWRFWVVGGGDLRYLKDLKLLIKKLRLNKVKFFGYVSERVKFNLLAKSHLLINPSIREGWGLVNIEANAVGTPVLGYKTQGLKDSVKHQQTGVLVPIGDIQALALVANELVLNKKRYLGMSKRAALWSRKFNWERQTKKSLSFIENLMKR